MEILNLVVFAFVFLICLCMVVFSIFTIVQNLLQIPPYMPSFNRDIRQVLTEIYNQKMDGHPNTPPKFIDLGCGDGKIVFLAARIGYEAYGVEINPFLFVWCKLRARFSAQPKPQFSLKSYFRQPLADYDVAFTYLFPETMRAIEEKMFTELPQGATIVSNTFKFKNHKPLSSFDSAKISVYQVS